VAAFHGTINRRLAKELVQISGNGNADKFLETVVQQNPVQEEGQMPAKVAQEHLPMSKFLVPKKGQK
jgi:hypothetical protein